MIRQILIATAISLIVFVLGCSSILSSIFSSPLVNLAAIAQAGPDSAQSLSSGGSGASDANGVTSLSVTPDLIIQDIVMPGLNGFQVLGLVRQHTKTPVIMLTTECYMDSVKSTLALGADDYVVKPFSARDLLARVREKIGRTGVGIPLLERDWT